MSQKTTNATRVAHLRELLDLSQIEFSDSIGITQGALSQLESGKTQLSFDSIRKINETYNVNCNWLIGKEEPIFLKEESSVVHSKNAMHNTQQTHDHALQYAPGLIPLVKEEAHAGYIDNYHDKDYLHTLDVYKIPGYEHGDYRLFEVEGDSMVPSIFPREVLVTEFVAKWSEIENGTLVIIVSADGIVAKRYYVHDDHSTVILKSDNPDYKTYSIPVNDIKEVWEIKAKITNVFAEDYNNQKETMKSMQADIDLLKNQMSELQKVR
ncbi:hypothetical protein TDB9533_02519 [Thalassocella blandensis]|nr:hypothetical protein TDB9533_02519 [Thalassocella blandensis]